MLARGADKVFASDVGSIDDNSPRNFPDTVSGWWVLLARWWPVRSSPLLMMRKAHISPILQWSTARSVPSFTEIQSRLT